MRLWESRTRISSLTGARGAAVISSLTDSSVALNIILDSDLHNAERVGPLCVLVSVGTHNIGHSLLNLCCVQPGLG